MDRTKGWVKAGKSSWSVGQAPLSNTSSDEKKTESLVLNTHEKLRTDGRKEKENVTSVNSSGNRRGGGFKSLTEEEYKKET